MMYGGKFKDFHIVGNCGGFLINFWFLEKKIWDIEFVTEY